VAHLKKHQQAHRQEEINNFTTIELPSNSGGSFFYLKTTEK
jgi:hypothetical protein